MDAAGDFTVAWTDWEPSPTQSGFVVIIGGAEPNDVFARRFNAAGVAQGNDFAVSQGLFKENFIAQVTMDAAGNAMISWFETNSDAAVA